MDPSVQRTATATLRANTGFECISRMTNERRNHYRLLHVQPEAPVEVIKAAYRALMSSLRAHPDLGGDTETAARLNAAYAVLSDPAQRRAYDLALKRKRATAAPGPSRAGTADAVSTAATAADHAAAPPRLEPGCALCGFALPGRIDALTRCAACDSPLMPAPRDKTHAGEMAGRRSAARHRREQPALLRLAGESTGSPARLLDLSLTGLSLHCSRAVPAGATVRISTDFFDALAQVVQCRRQANMVSLHARLLTLQLLRPSGVYVNARA